MPTSYSVTSSVKPADQNALTQADVSGNTVAGVLLIVIPLSIVLGAVLYKKFRPKHRATLLLEQIETLERSWRISRENKY
ncbi:hypothetical protein H6F74_16020 [Trichocoleus sp. FACHB-90]|uniref:hypothetical protein n=1 Tax=Cyanophyceae TaxID=3028117 RepID=UPI001685508C|nr:hypothetical protein [Trichocoleus sp. FACHB-90]MBD1927738.1 hypothetical protein [Trichocoleus sp. FACHB-90]